MAHLVEFLGKAAATWEDVEEIRAAYPQFYLALEDKDNLKNRGIDTSIGEMGQDEEVNLANEVLVSKRPTRMKRSPTWLREFVN
ncbi:UNVERIFIED_CONTAM: hypothetical protein Sradi_3610600 [Sesamum radiatum]|uniref:Uncharacterized protein n=1 Tax=Sesamum radiatum TaxID=300843 RepID=A0AAW2QH59_SESRA